MGQKRRQCVTNEQQAIDTRLGATGLDLATNAVAATTVGPWTGMISKNTKFNLATVIDGLSNTIALAESAGRPDIYRRRGRLSDRSRLSEINSDDQF